MERSIASLSLQREVRLSIRLPLHYDANTYYPLLLVNDGQDFGRLKMNELLNDLESHKLVDPFIVVGIHAGTDRLQEYGTAHQSDYAGRGSKAGETTHFVLYELLPFLRQNYSIREKKMVYAGFSLGGLMALDIAWNHNDVFSKAGVFSGALWWRQKALDAGYHDHDRIMHEQIRASWKKPNLKFWFQAGTSDETDDRDQDGVIDSIQDTLECIGALERKGYVWGSDITYFEMAGGEHNPETWSIAMPEFLIWAFGSKNDEKP